MTLAMNAAANPTGRSTALQAPPEGSRIGWRLGFFAMVSIYLALGLYCSRILATWDDETAYVALSRLVVTGGISLFQDDMTGQRMPLPFYILGSSQMLFGRNLFAARVLSVILGLAALGLTVAVARRLHGLHAGLFAGLLLAAQGNVVAYYATATYHSLTALILLASLWCLLRSGLPCRGAAAAGIASLLFLTRTNMFTALPFLLTWAFLASHRGLERLAVVALAVGVPGVFFLADTTHLKLLAHVPFLSRLVEPLGYHSILLAASVEHASRGDQLWALVLFA